MDGITQSVHDAFRDLQPARSRSVESGHVRRYGHRFGKPEQLLFGPVYARRVDFQSQRGAGAYEEIQRRFARVPPDVFQRGWKYEHARPPFRIRKFLHFFYSFPPPSRRSGSAFTFARVNAAETAPVTSSNASPDAAAAGADIGVSAGFAPPLPSGPMVKAVS